MHHYSTVRRVPYSHSKFFNVVADVEKYPQFLPLCQRLTILEQDQVTTPDRIIADMTVVYKMVRETFRSEVLLDREENTIIVRAIDGPFRVLENDWHFEAIDDNTTDVHFHLRYEFRSRALQMMMGKKFEKAFRKYAEIFETRTGVIYGSNKELL